MNSMAIVEGEYKQKLNCDYCGSLLWRTVPHINEYNFCDMVCSTAFRRKYPDKYRHGRKKYVKKIESWASLRQDLPFLFDFTFRECDRFGFEKY